VFPGHRIGFANDLPAFVEVVCAEFPQQADRFRKLVQHLDEYDETSLTQESQSARSVCGEYLSDPVLVDMLFCPVMFYGSATPHDMEFGQFCIMFKSIFAEGFGRPFKGVRQILKTLTRHYKELGGELKLRHGVREMLVRRGRAVGVVLDDGTEIEAENVLSSAGLVETLALAESGETRDERQERRDMSGGAATTLVSPLSALDSPLPGQISFNEAIFVLDCQPHDLGHDETIVFYNDAPQFHYEPPTEPLDLRSGIICSPNNFQYANGQQLDEGFIRITSLADPDYWMRLPEDEYVVEKEQWGQRMIESAIKHIPDFRSHIIETDIFTPRTITKFTGHPNGAVYGAPNKVLTGTTPVEGLYLCGTDQGFLGIIGAMLSGITMANNHLLR
jgi:phytoene dehydrogenase-like protein